MSCSTKLKVMNGVCSVFFVAERHNRVNMEFDQLDCLISANAPARPKELKTSNQYRHGNKQPKPWSANRGTIG